MFCFPESGVLRQAAQLSTDSPLLGRSRLSMCPLLWILSVRASKNWNLDRFLNFSILGTQRDFRKTPCLRHRHTLVELVANFVVKII